MATRTEHEVHTMKSLAILIILTVMFATGCSPKPMGVDAAGAFQACLTKGWVPRYFSNVGKVDFTCQAHKKPIPVNEHAASTMEACILKDKNAIYDSPTGRVLCIQKGGSFQLSN